MRALLYFLCDACSALLALLRMSRLLALWSLRAALRSICVASLDCSVRFAVLGIARFTLLLSFAWHCWLCVVAQLCAKLALLALRDLLCIARFALIALLCIGLQCFTLLCIARSA